MELIFKVKNDIQNQFKHGVKIRPDRLNPIDLGFVIQNDKISKVFKIDNENIKYNARTKTIELNSILGEELTDHELIGEKVNYQTFNPATINNIDQLLIK